MTDPKCPECGGTVFRDKRIISSGLIRIVYCDKCGHIIGCISFS